jgi:hypothetical protein
VPRFETTEIFAVVFTVISTKVFADPPGPEHEIVYVLFDKGDTERDPAVAWLPDHAPLAVQLVAFVVDHVSMLDWPRLIDVGVAEIVTVGAVAAALTTTVSLTGALFPPAFAQVSVYVYVFTVLSTPID